MKILYYSSHPNLNLASPSGYGTHMREMINAFEALGHEVKPVIMGGTVSQSGNLTINGRGPFKSFVASCVPAYLWESVKDYKLKYFDNHALNTLEEEIISFQPDIIYERATYLQTSGVKVANKLKIRHVLEVNAPYVEERRELQGDSIFAKAGAKAEKSQLELTDKVVVVSSALKNYFISRYNLISDKFIVTPNAINSSLLNFDPSRTEAIRVKLQLEQKVVIGFVGSIFPWHGVDLLIHAFKMLISSGRKNVHLLIVGDGHILPSLKKQSAAYGLSDKITFTGNIAHHMVFDYIKLMDICVMGKSNWYGSPVKIFEYGALGKAVIAPDTIPVMDVCSHKENSILIKPTPEYIFEAIELLINDQVLRDTISNKFKEQILSKHTWINNAEKVLASIT